MVTLESLINITSITISVPEQLVTFASRLISNRCLSITVIEGIGQYHKALSDHSTSVLIASVTNFINETDQCLNTTEKKKPHLYSSYILEIEM